MIINSTPGSITYESQTGKRITFFGEWTLEPKFYLNIPDNKNWDAPFSSIKLSDVDFKECLNNFLMEAAAKGWEIVIDQK
jgi:hypothetical protein